MCIPGNAFNMFFQPSFFFFFVGYALIFVQFSLGVLSGLVIAWVNSKNIAWVISDSLSHFKKYFLVRMGSSIAFLFEFLSFSMH